MLNIYEYSITIEIYCKIRPLSITIMLYLLSETISIQGSSHFLIRYKTGRAMKNICNDTHYKMSASKSEAALLTTALSLDKHELVIRACPLEEHEFSICQC